MIAGSSNSVVHGDKSDPSKGTYDYWIVKINDFGQKIWDKSVGGSYSDFPNSIIQTSDGGLGIVGQSYSSEALGDKSEVSKGGSDYWIVKLGGTTTPLITISL
ncbi:MAG: T9SS C-terminal target domain-containing protein, partial [Cytophagaceae bacterium]|nr:T9SS C-terminal target domain-containing protein [Cytophagaceae bacterium]